ncbi:MAG: hypothetical protein H6823_15415 [Planctomycetaceae bacterium]|nr:hypothetical protein [Planctomycetaceae bacterium]
MATSLIVLAEVANVSEADAARLVTTSTYRLLVTVERHGIRPVSADHMHLGSQARDLDIGILNERDIVVTPVPCTTTVSSPVPTLTFTRVTSVPVRLLIVTV